MKAIYVVGYPRSGCTWLTRLISSSLGLAAGGAHPALDDSEPATQDGDKPVVRKGHYKLMRSSKEMNSPVPEPKHEMYWRALTSEPVFYIVRDPRDVAVSGSHYWPDFTVSRFLHYMAYKRPWWKHVAAWLYLPYPVHVVRYEDLLEDTYECLTRQFRFAGLGYEENQVQGAIDHWDFDAHVERGASRRMLRKGEVGDWRNHFDENMRKKATEYFGDLMVDLGYTL